jgi:hypothetical protein
MPVLNLEYGFLFACNPGTGSTSVSHALINQCNSQWFPKESIRINQVFIEFKHGLLKQIKQYKLIDSETFDKLFKFVFVRNPYTFLLSDYLRHIQWRELLENPNSWVHQQPAAIERIEFANNSSFQEYLVWKNKGTNSIDLFYYQTECVDKIYKLEEVDEFLRDFYNRFNFDLKIKQINKTKKSTKMEDNQELLTKDVVNYINEIYEPTFTRYNYPKL